jgi:hypothetical protein
LDEKGDPTPAVSQPLSLAAWRSRQFRVFYQIDPENLQVRIVAIGVKDRNRLLVGGEEVTL